MKTTLTGRSTAPTRHIHLRYIDRAGFARRYLIETRDVGELRRRCPRARVESEGFYLSRVVIPMPL